MPSSDSSSTAAQPGQKQSLYAAHEKVYPRKVWGTFRRLKWLAMGVLLGAYYLAPWIRWDRGPDAPNQALLIDMPGRRAYFFGLEIWPQEIYYLTGLLILGAIGLFMVTALFGRVWCGFTCVQTVWTDLFMWVERVVEGDRAQRIRLDKGRLTAAKAGKKLVKHALWAAIAFATGGAWIMYFVDAPTLVREFFTGQSSMTVYGFTALFSGFTYLLAGWAREQVCIYMCPWPRFQSAMFDEDSLIVTYEAWRGEPRAPARKTDDFSQRGHCIDCKQCVQVCPTGIDIRDGQQMACIGCALCVDACNNMMDRHGLPRNLVTYDSIHNQVAREKGEPTKTRLLRPRVFVYIAVLAIVVAVMAVSLATRSRLEINVLRDRAPLFVMLSDGSIRNGYTYKLLNMEREAKTYELSVDGIEGATLHVIGYSDDGVKTVTLPAKPDDVGTYRVFVRAPRASLDGPATDMTFVLKNVDTGVVTDHETVFAGPRR
jgi:cytochrome c oxidase accessory protein FixG